MIYYLSYWYDDRTFLSTRIRFFTLCLISKRQSFLLSYKKESMTPTSYRRESHRKSERHFFCSWKRKKISIRQLPQKTFKLLSFQKEYHFYRFLLMILIKTKIIENKGFRAIHSIFHRHWAFYHIFRNVLYW